MQGSVPPTSRPADALAGASHDDSLDVLPAGTVVGKYEVVETLGQGAFGITYRARDAQLGREVAIKEYLPTAFAQRQGGSTVRPRSTRTADDFLWGRERFLDEARTLVRLESGPGIVNVYDFLEANGTAYMVMTLVRGETLEARLRREGRLAQAVIERFLPPLLDGLEVVHNAGFLHRDIKPSNILLDAAGRPTLIDFGASRMALHGRTQVMTAIYTPGYAAPEQMVSARQGAWTDIYALAGTLYHCVTGRMPPSAMERATGDDLVAAADAGKGHYAPGLLAAIDAGLKLKAGDRPQTIAAWRRSLPGISPASMAASADTATARPGEARAPATDGRGSRWKRVLARTAAGVVVVTLACGVAWYVTEELERRAEAERAALAFKQRQEAEAREAAARERLRQDGARRLEEEERERQEAERWVEEERQRLEAEDRRKAEEEARAAAQEKARLEELARRKAAAAAQGWSIDDKSGCRIRNPKPATSESVTWSGDCVNGMAQGRGTLQWSEDGRPTGSYTGEMREGNRNGRGVSTDREGGRYDGDWRDNKRSGRGVYTWPDGRLYVGEWEDDRPHGGGTFRKGGAVHAGPWVHGCFRQGNVTIWIGKTEQECGFK